MVCYTIKNIDKNIVSSSQIVNSVFIENTTKTLVCKKLRAIFLCHYRVPNADFARFLHLALTRL